MHQHLYASKKPALSENLLGLAEEALEPRLLVAAKPNLGELDQPNDQPPAAARLAVYPYFKRSTVEENITTRGTNPRPS